MLSSDNGKAMKCETFADSKTIFYTDNNRKRDIDTVWLPLGVMVEEKCAQTLN